MKTRCVAPMLVAKIGYIVMSILYCAAGVLFIALPQLSASLIGICIGIAMIAFGAVKLVGYFSKDLYRLAFQYDLEFGILLIVLGVIVLFNNERLMNFICIVLGIAILLDGLFKIRIAVDSKTFGISTWWLILALAIITAGVGVALIADCAVGAELLTVLLGASLLCEGVLNLYTVISTVLIVKNQMPDVIEAESVECERKDRWE